jgi:hypothetical protein
MPAFYKREILPRPPTMNSAFFKGARQEKTSPLKKYPTTKTEQEQCLPQETSRVTKRLCLSYCPSLTIHLLLSLSPSQPMQLLIHVVGLQATGTLLSSQSSPRPRGFTKVPTKAWLSVCASIPFIFLTLPVTRLLSSFPSLHPLLFTPFSLPHPETRPGAHILTI